MTHFTRQRRKNSNNEYIYRPSPRQHLAKPNNTNVSAFDSTSIFTVGPHVRTDKFHQTSTEFMLLEMRIARILMCIDIRSDVQYVCGWTNSKRKSVINIGYVGCVLYITKVIEFVLMVVFYSMNPLFWLAHANTQEHCRTVSECLTQTGAN